MFIHALLFTRVTGETFRMVYISCVFLFSTCRCVNHWLQARGWYR